MLCSDLPKYRRLSISHVVGRHNEFANSHENTYPREIAAGMVINFYYWSVNFSFRIVGRRFGTLKIIWELSLSLRLSLSVSVSRCVSVTLSVCVCV